MDKNIIKNIGLQIKCTIKLYCDNKAAINLSNNHIFHDHTKHVQIDKHFNIEKINSKEFTLPYVKTQDQVADMFTKGLSSSDIEKNICKLGTFDMYTQLSEVLKIILSGLGRIC